MKKFLLMLFCFLFLFVPVIFAEEVTLTLEWDANTEDFLQGYKGYVGDAEGGPYIEFGNVIAPVITIDYVYDAPSGVKTTKYFVVTAYSNHVPMKKSGYSNEVNYTYDFAPIEVVTEFMASLDGDNIIFTWKQGDIERVKEWHLFVSESIGGEYNPLAVIEYTGQGGPQYTTTEQMIVPDGEIKTFYFVLVTFTKRDVFSANSAEVNVTIDKRFLAPVYNLTIKVMTQ